MFLECQENLNMDWLFDAIRELFIFPRRCVLKYLGMKGHDAYFQMYSKN